MSDTQPEVQRAADDLVKRYRSDIDEPYIIAELGREVLKNPIAVEMLGGEKSVTKTVEAATDFVNRERAEMKARQDNINGGLDNPASGMTVAHKSKWVTQGGVYEDRTLVGKAPDGKFYLQNESTHTSGEGPIERSSIDGPFASVSEALGYNIDAELAHYKINPADQAERAYMAESEAMRASGRLSARDPLLDAAEARADVMGDASIGGRMEFEDPQKTLEGVRGIAREAAGLPTKKQSTTVQTGNQTMSETQKHKPFRQSFFSRAAEVVNRTWHNMTTKLSFPSQESRGYHFNSETAHKRYKEQEKYAELKAAQQSRSEMGPKGEKITVASSGGWKLGKDGGVESKMHVGQSKSGFHFRIESTDNRTFTKVGSWSEAYPTRGRAVLVGLREQDSKVAAPRKDVAVGAQENKVAKSAAVSNQKPEVSANYWLSLAGGKAASPQRELSASQNQTARLKM